MQENEPYKIFPGEIAWLRRLNADNPNDIKIYKLIEAQSEVARWMENEDMTIEEVKELLSDEDQAFYGICSNKNQDEADGWVSLYEPETELIDRLIEQKLIDSKDAKILEISFARYINPNVSSESRKRGLISSATRQICFSLIEKQENNVIIVGFTNPQNIPSENTLKSAGFIIKGKILYDEESKEEDNFWVLDKKELEKILEKKKAKQV